MPLCLTRSEAVPLSCPTACIHAYLHTETVMNGRRFNGSSNSLPPIVDSSSAEPPPSPRVHAALATTIDDVRLCDGGGDRDADGGDGDRDADGDGIGNGDGNVDGGNATAATATTATGKIKRGRTTPACFPKRFWKSKSQRSLAISNPIGLPGNDCDQLNKQCVNAG